MAFTLAEFQRLIVLVESADTADKKGTSFESLCQYLLECLDGVEVRERDIQLAAEEIDLVLWNAQIEEVLRPWEAVILVECKNWSSTVGAPSLDSFIGKLRRRSLKTGIFIAAHGVTGSFVNGDGRELGAAAIIRSALQEGIRVITLTLDDLKPLRDVDEFRHLIKSRYCGLYVHRVF